MALSEKKAKLHLNSTVILLILVWKIDRISRNLHLNSTVILLISGRHYVINPEVTPFKFHCDSINIDNRSRRH